VPENLSSIAVMERVGMTRAPDLDQDLPVWKIENHRSDRVGGGMGS
jgi:RimJ/RimL family protein N-acetyltransferase